jgi:hypothetical protein
VVDWRMFSTQRLNIGQSFTQSVAPGHSSTSRDRGGDNVGASGSRLLHEKGKYVNQFT